MQTFDVVALLTVLTALLSYVNVRVLKLPSAIGLMALTLVFCTGLLLAESVVPGLADFAKAAVAHFSFGEALLHGMLGFLLFAGALHFDVGDLHRNMWPIAVLATVGVVLSTALVGSMSWLAFNAAGFPVRPIDALLFGALISPTDPIAVLGLLKQAGAPRRLEAQIAGESLFNDGVGVVLFLGLLGVSTGREPADAFHITAMFIREALGGAAFGLAVGLVFYRMFKSVDHYQVEILLSLALVTGGYAAADALHLSGPIATVVAGLVIGNHGRRHAMSAVTKANLDLFWELIDETLNAVLFVALGMELLVLRFTGRGLAVGAVAVVIVLVARLVSVGLPVWVLRRSEAFEPAAVPILTWGGLRGGISVALALSIPANGPGGGPSRDLILGTTYVVVVFSILVQGLTLRTFTRHWLGRVSRSPQVRSALGIDDPSA